MQTLRNAHLIARFVLVWFALSIGVTIASPIVKPQAMALICSSVGGMKLLAQSDDGRQDVVSLTMDCPLCLTHGAAPPPLACAVALAPVQPLAYVMQSRAAAHLASRTAAALPARGPPAFL